MSVLELHALIDNCQFDVAWQRISDGDFDAIDVNDPTLPHSLVSAACCWGLCSSQKHELRRRVLLWLISRGADVRSRYTDLSSSPLMHLCSMFDLTEEIKALIDHGANIGDCDSNGCTALHYAAANERLEHVQLLLAYGADPSVTNENGKQPWQVTTNSEIAELLSGGGSSTKAAKR